MDGSCDLDSNNRLYNKGGDGCSRSAGLGVFATPCRGYREVLVMYKDTSYRDPIFDSRPTIVYKHTRVLSIHALSYGMSVGVASRQQFVANFAV